MCKNIYISVYRSTRGDGHPRDRETTGAAGLGAQGFSARGVRVRLPEQAVRPYRGTDHED